MGRGAHGGHGDGHLCHDHDCEEANCAAEFSLHEQVDKPRVRALNEELRAISSMADAVILPATASRSRGVPKPQADIGGEIPA